MPHVTKQHFQLAAEQVRAILNGEWTDDLPSWATGDLPGVTTSNAIRAIQTAEAYVLFFQHANPRFNADRFLMECGLIHD